MPDFLLELRSEEIPARMQARARADLERLFAEELAGAGLRASAIQTYATPRRLALIARELPDATEATFEERRGPRADAPAQAIEGFLKSTGLTRDQLEEREDKKGARVLFAVISRPGRPTADVLAEAVPAVLRAFPWPKSMRWGAASLSTESPRWVRPLQGIVALFGEELVPVEAAGVHATAWTLGHRIHHPGPITLGGAHDYEAKLRACHVILDGDERARMIVEGARALAAERGLQLVEDEALAAENAGLTEWPVPLLGSFDPGFLPVPREVIQLTMRTNQKYFSLTDAAGALAPAFICVANLDATDGGEAITRGNERVLAARLADARFFWEGDLKVPLETQAAKLEQIVFHEKLGTVADKVERVARLARWLVEEGVAKPSRLVGEGGDPPRSGGEDEGRGREAHANKESSQAADAAWPLTQPSPTRGEGSDLADLATRAARLCKADLVTGTVGEFPEVQGIAGGHIALAQGEHPAVAAAIRDHYKPVGQSDDVPTEPVTVAVSLADKLDTLFGFFAMYEKPSGSRDPFALRRAALAAIRLITINELRLRLSPVLYQWLEIIASVGYQWSLDSEAIRAERLRAEGTAQDFDLRASGYSRQTIEEFDSGSRHPELPVEHYIFREVGDAGGDWLTLQMSFVVDEIELLQKYSDQSAILQLPIDSPVEQARTLLDFLADRLKVQQREAGVRHDLIDAVFALGGEDDIVRLLARVRALQAFMGTEDGANLHIAYKRAANILKKEGRENRPPPLVGSLDGSGVQTAPGSLQIVPGAQSAPAPTSDGGDPPRSDGAGEGRAAEGRATEETSRSADAGRPLTQPSPTRGEGAALSYTPLPEEQSLLTALDSAQPRAREAVEREEFEAAMSALASLRAPIDAFFDKVTVNDPDPAKRAARLALLARFRDAVHAVADFSRIEG